MLKGQARRKVSEKERERERQRESDEVHSQVDLWFEVDAHTAGQMMSIDCPEDESLVPANRGIVSAFDIERLDIAAFRSAFDVLEGFPGSLAADLHVAGRWSVCHPVGSLSKRTLRCSRCCRILLPLLGS